MPAATTAPALSPRYSEAPQSYFEIHSQQRRKGSVSELIALAREIG